MFGVISASYTDHGGAGGVPALTTVDQNQIRQKKQEVEFAVNQSGTNTAATADVGGGLQRGGLSAGDWIELNGPFNLLNINEITFRTRAAPPVATPVRSRSGEMPSQRRRRPAAHECDHRGHGQRHDLRQSDVPDLRHWDPPVLPGVPPAAGGPGNNFFNLNWVEFVGAGVGT